MTADNDQEELLDRAVDAIVAAARSLDSDPKSSSQGIRNPSDALAMLERLESALTAAGGNRATTRLLDVRSAQADLLTGQLAKQRSMLPVLNRALQELRGAATVEQLADAVPFQSVQLGYDRAMFSWVDPGELWVPRSAHMADAPDMGAAVIEAGGPPYVHLRDVLEVDVVRQRRPLLALDVEGNPRVHQRLWAITHSRTYVAAPVVARGRVAALVHLDRNIESGTTEEFDRDLLAAFCQGIGLMLDHLIAASGDSGTVPEALASWPTALTTREREVLQWVAAGLTNAEIGARLFLGEETVKTHLKKLMRKLGVHNRSQASALYIRYCETLRPPTG
jgi:DNA-binding CsgD family transcriptional regulator